MKILVYFASILVFLIQLMTVNLTAGSSSPLLDVDDSQGEKDVMFQDRLVERLSSLAQSVDQSISTVNNISFVMFSKGIFSYSKFIRQMLSEERNPPLAQLLKGNPYKELANTYFSYCINHLLPSVLFRNLSQNANARTQRRIKVPLSRV